MEKLQVKNCIICETTKIQGILVVSEFICVECLAAISQSVVSENNYADYVRKMKPIWTNLQSTWKVCDHVLKKVK